MTMVPIDLPARSAPRCVLWIMYAAPLEMEQWRTRPTPRRAPMLLAIEGMNMTIEEHLSAMFMEEGAALAGAANHPEPLRQRIYLDRSRSAPASARP